MIAYLIENAVAFTQNGGQVRLEIFLPTPRCAVPTLAHGPDLWVTWPVTKGFLLPEEGAEQLAVTGV